MPSSRANPFIGVDVHTSRIDRRIGSHLTALINVANSQP